MTELINSGINGLTTVRTSQATYNASNGEIVITDGDKVSLPSPEQGATVLVKPLASYVNLETASGAIANETSTARYDGDSALYLVSDGTNWYSRSELKNIGPVIPDSALYHYPILERSNSTIVEELANEDATANGVTNTQGNWLEGYAEVGDGVDDYISFPSAVFDWLNQTNSIWLAITVDANPSDTNYTSNDVIFGVANTSVNDFWQIRDDAGGGGLEWLLNGGDDLQIGVRTDNSILDGNKHRLVFQLTDSTTANGLEIWVDGNEAPTTAFIDESYNAGLTAMTPFGLARELDGSPDSHLPSSCDNWIFGQTGTTLTAQEIQNDYDAQPWS
jgi:hypothetical protein